MKAKNLFLFDCHLAGRKYHDVDLVWDELRVGMHLDLVKDTDNKFDPYAVAVVYTDVEDEQYLLGYIPKDKNRLLSDFLEMGWSKLFTCTISKLAPDAHPENQIHLTIKLERNPKMDR